MRHSLHETVETQPINERGLVSDYCHRQCFAYSLFQSLHFLLSRIVGGKAAFLVLLLKLAISQPAYFDRLIRKDFFRMKKVESIIDEFYSLMK